MNAKRYSDFDTNCQGPRFYDGDPTMTKTSGDVLIPLTNSGRKYGYITWNKKHDSEIGVLLGNAGLIDLQIGDSLQTGKRNDWKNRRIGITYTLTRSLPKTAKRIRLKSLSKNCVMVSFR
jgi:hypothetical protein